MTISTVKTEVANTGTSGGTSLTVPRNNYSTDNLLVAFWYCPNSAGVTTTPDANWDTIVLDNDGEGNRAIIGVKVPEGNSNDDWVTAISSSKAQAAFVRELTSDTGTVEFEDFALADVDGHIATGTSTPTGTKSPLTAAGMALAIWGGRNMHNWTTNATFGGMTPPFSGTGLTYDYHNSANLPGTAVVEKLYTDTSSISGNWSTSDTGDESFGALVILKEVVSGGGPATVLPNDIGQAQSIDNITLTQGHSLSIAGISQGNSIDAVSLTQASTLAVAGLAQDNTIDNVTLTQAHVIAVNDLGQGQALDAVALTQANILAVAGIDQAQLIDATALTQAGILAIADLGQANTIENLTLTVAGSLAIQGVAQSQTLDGATLTQAGVLSVAGLTQSQIVDAAALTQHYALVIADLLQGQSLDNVALSLSGASLSVDDIGQGQAIDQAWLTEYAVLSVNDLTQSQILDIVTLGGLVIGCLQGEAVIYALVGGQITVYHTLDGTVTTVH